MAGYRIPRARVGSQRWLRWSMMTTLAWGTPLAWGCGGDEPATTVQRGVPGKKKRKKTIKKIAEVELPPTRPDERPAPVLTRETFSREARDPFRPYLPVQTTDVEVSNVDDVKHRAVRMRNYDFDDLRLIAIVRSGRRVRPRALFVGTDGISKSVEQGQYFSRNEVLLATVNSDYIEIEIVDEELAGGLEMQRGERRAIYLNKE